MLNNSKAVFVWRRVDNVSEALDRSPRLFGIEPIGRDEFSAIFDAGNILLGFWSQKEFLSSPVARADHLSLSSEAAALASNSCGEINFLATVSDPDPTFQLAFAADDLGPQEKAVADTFRAAFRPAREEALGQAVSFFDESGNHFAFVRPESGAGAGELGNAMRRLHAGDKQGARGKARPLSLNLQVADLKISARFYGEVLGLRSAGEFRGTLNFDLGTILLSLREEQTPGLVRALGSKGRFNSDLLVFHAPEIDGLVRRLQEKDIKFPHGIERSAYGAMATFFDPDGHPLALWEPGKEDAAVPINFFPALHRILAS